MPNDIDVLGVASLARASRAFREAGEQGKGLRRELTKSINAETKNTRREMRQAIKPALPHGGGLDADVAGSTRFTTSVRLGDNPGVRIRAKGRRSIRRMNQTGSFRHPVFGNRAVWVSQRATVALKHFLDRPFQHAKPELQRAVLGAVTRVRANILRSIR